MNGYFRINIAFVTTLLLAVALYVGYLYYFRAQTPDPFQLRENCDATEVEKGTRKAQAFFERYMQVELERNPELKSYFGASSATWTALTTTHYTEQQILEQEMLHYLEDSIVACECLDEQAQMSAKLLKAKIELNDVLYEDAWQSKLDAAYWVNFLIRFHPITTEEEAQNYIQRVQGIAGQIDAVLALIEQRPIEQQQHWASFLLPELLETIDALLEGMPLTKAKKEQVLYADFTQKIQGLELEETKKVALINQLQKALEASFVPAYKNLSSYWEKLKEASNPTASIDVLEHYIKRLQLHTSSNISPEDAFQLGQEEVVRIHEEIKKMMPTFSFDGSVEDFLAFLRGKESIPLAQKVTINPLKSAQSMLEDTEGYLETWFGAVEWENIELEVFEESLPYSFPLMYREPSISNKLLLNSPKLNSLYAISVPALVAKNILPGHYLKRIGQDTLSLLHQVEAWFPAYNGGWNAYALGLSESVFGAHAYHQLGRLLIQLRDACRMVVDLGIYTQHWDRAQALRYYQEKTPNASEVIRTELRQHIFHPARAVAAEIGLITILELKQKAMDELQEQFELKAFHKVLLNQGNVSLDMLQDAVDDYISQTLND